MSLKSDRTRLLWSIQEVLLKRVFFQQTTSFTLKRALVNFGNLFTFYVCDLSDLLELFAMADQAEDVGVVM